MSDNHIRTVIRRPEHARHLPRPEVASDERADAQVPPVKAEVRGLSFSYGPVEVLKNLQMSFVEKKVTALIGPSGCGKTTLLRCFNRLHDLYPKNRYVGEILLYPDGINIISGQVDPIGVRMRISMVFQKPNPFPKSIFENVAYGLRLRGVRHKSTLNGMVEAALRAPALWEESKDRLQQPAYALSGGQQQRLCIARSLAIDPEILLCDEPTSALDPMATARIEELLHALKDRVTIIIVTHSMQQAARVSDYTGFLYMGELVEMGPTAAMFRHSSNPLTEQYITGRFG